MAWTPDIGGIGHGFSPMHQDVMASQYHTITMSVAFDAMMLRHRYAVM
jgi:hypothetical protein